MTKQESTDSGESMRSSGLQIPNMLFHDQSKQRPTTSSNIHKDDRLTPDMDTPRATTFNKSV